MKFGISDRLYRTIWQGESNFLSKYTHNIFYYLKRYNAFQSTFKFTRSFVIFEVSYICFSSIVLFVCLQLDFSLPLCASSPLLNIYSAGKINFCQTKMVINVNNFNCRSHWERDRVFVCVFEGMNISHSLGQSVFTNGLQKVFNVCILGKIAK